MSSVQCVSEWEAFHMLDTLRPTAAVCTPDLPDFDQLLQEADDRLFERILQNPHTHCISYFHHNLQHHRTITSDVASMTDNCMNTKGT